MLKKIENFNYKCLNTVKKDLTSSLTRAAKKHSFYNNDTYKTEIYGYYNNNKLCAFIAYKYKSHRKLSLLDYGYNNRISFIKMLLLFFYTTDFYSIDINNTLLKDLNITIPDKYEDFIFKNKTKTKINLSVSVKDMPIGILTKIYILCHINKSLDGLYFCLISRFNATQIKEHLNFIFKCFFKVQKSKLDLLEFNNTVRIVLETQKFLYNGGEINYCKVLNKNGYSQLDGIPCLYNDKTYYLENIQNPNKKVCKILTFEIKDIDTSKLQNKGTFAYYRNLLKFIKKINKGKTFYFLNSNNAIIASDSLEIPVYKTYIFKSLLINELYLEKLFNVFNQYSSQTNDFYYLSKYSMIQLRKRIGEEKAILFFEKFFKELSKSENIVLFYHDNYLLTYYKIINNKYLTDKAVETLIYSSKKEFNLYLNTLKEISSFLGSIKNIDTKFYRKRISAFIKKKQHDKLCSFYNDIVKNILEDYFKEQPKEFVSRLLDFHSKLMIYDNVQLMTFINIFKNELPAIIDGSMKCIFKEHSIDFRQEKISTLVKQALGSKSAKGLLSRPKSLYNALRKICNINEILNGTFPIKYCTSILNELKIRNIPIPEDILYWVKIEKKCSPEFLMAGNITDCCMDFGSRKAFDYAIEEGFGIISVYSNDNIVSNSLIWIHDTLNYLVLDNIECIQKFIKKHSLIKKQYKLMIKYILSEYNLKLAVQGTGYNDIILYNKRNNNKYFKRIKFPINARSVTDQNFYSDANYIYPVFDKEILIIQSDLNPKRKK